MSAEITNLLQRLHAGDRDALDTLAPLVYQELHGIAKREMRRDRPNHTLQTTALVHEAFLRIFGVVPPSFQDRAHFLGVVARVMRQVLVDHARARKSKKRGGGLILAIQGDHPAATPPLIDILAVDQALEDLTGEDPHLVKLIEMRYFAGMTAEEAAEVLGESVHVVRHDIRYALARLRQQLDPDHAKN